MTTTERKEETRMKRKNEQEVKDEHDVEKKIRGGSITRGLSFFLLNISSRFTLFFFFSSSSSCHEKEDAGFMCNFDLWLHASRLLLFFKTRGFLFSRYERQEKEGYLKRGTGQEFSPDCNERSLLNLFVFSLEIAFDCKRRKLIVTSQQEEEESQNTKKEE